MLIPSSDGKARPGLPSLSRRVNANSQPQFVIVNNGAKLIKKGEC